MLGIPAPKVHTWSSSNDNPVGAEYIIMEQVAGIELAKVWDEMEERERVHIITEIVDIHKSFAATRFPCYGSLYYAQPPGKNRGSHFYPVTQESKCRYWPLIRCRSFCREEFL